MTASRYWRAEKRAQAQGVYDAAWTLKLEAFQCPDLVAQDYMHKAELALVDLALALEEEAEGNGETTIEGASECGSRYGRAATSRPPVGAASGYTGGTATNPGDGETNSDTRTTAGNATQADQRVPGEGERS